MASAAPRAIAATKSSGTEKIVDFAPERIKAPFILRCAALAVDYILLLATPVLWLIVSKLLSETPGDVGIGAIGWLVGSLVFIVNFLLLPLRRGQSLGKMVAGLTILQMDGQAVDAGAVVRRNLIGYAATILTLGFGFLLAVITERGRALHDLIGGTVVVRGRKTRKEN
ncbi:MAG TPA: RDD family protein [Pyrinomonadaceae bacterium]|nr:RDD family protein [Pyrinomonadaceae bacterium]